MQAGPEDASRRPLETQGEGIEIKPAKPTMKGPAEWFTGDEWLDGIAQGEEPSPLNVSAVHVSRGARTAWHAQRLGQTLHVTEGEGLVQSLTDEKYGAERR